MTSASYPSLVFAGGLGGPIRAGPCGYAAHRTLGGLGQTCILVAPLLIPSRPGDRVKTNRRDATAVAKLHRAGDLTAVWVPDAAHEAMRDLVRARATARRMLAKARQHLPGFLLRHGRIYRGVRSWTKAYRRWLSGPLWAEAQRQFLARTVRARRPIRSSEVNRTPITRVVTAPTAC